MDYLVEVQFLKQADPILSQLIEQVGICRLPAAKQRSDLFFALSESILYQQLSSKAAETIHRRFLQLYPETLSPAAIDVLNTPDEVLRRAGVSRQKSAYLKDLAQKVLDGLPTLAELEELDDETIIRTLTQVKGIGRWTVQMLLIFQLNRLDVLPVDDLGVRSGIQKVYGLDALPHKKLVEQLGENWKPYRSIASWYLWRSLELKREI
jgi:DNA-3-methyladenine glycosylase II